LVGKKFYRQVTKNVRWEVEVLSESLTHCYIKIIIPLENPNGRKRAWNVSKSWFLSKYKEIL
jgi:hypothetical protein